MKNSSLMLKTALVALVCFHRSACADTSSFNAGGTNLQFQKGITSALFQSVASFDGNQLQLSNNSSVAVEAFIRDRNGYVIATTLIPPAKGGPLGEVLDINVKGTLEKFVNSFKTGTPVTASVVHTGLTAEDIKQGVSIEIVAGTKRAQTLTAITLLMDGLSKIAEASNVVQGLDFTKPLSRESVVVLTNLADKLSTDSNFQSLLLGQGKIGPVIRDAVKDAFVDIAKDYASQQLKTTLISAGGAQVKAALTALEGVKDYEEGIFIGTKLYAAKALSTVGPTSTGFLALQLNGQTPEYLLKGTSATYRLQITPGFLGVGTAAVVTQVNNNVAPSGAPTSLVNSTSQSSGEFHGALAYATGAGTADFDTFRSSASVSGGRLQSWDFAAIGQVAKGNLNGAQFADTNSVSTTEGPIYWGRWVGNSQITTNAGVTVLGRGVNYAFGSAAIALPSNSQFTYSFAGGTPIVSGGGTVGQALQSGTISVNTGTQAVQLNNFRFGFATGSAFGAALFTMNGAATYSSTLRFSGTLNGSCSGGNCGANLASTGGFAGRFTGATGTGIALTYGAVTNNNAVGGVASAAFKR